MNRRFGIELEMTGITRERAAAALGAVGIEVQVQDYNHTTSRAWKIVPDGSVSDGFEVVSPILEGETGIEAACIVTNALKTAGAKTDRRCGFHVHFDAQGLGANELRSIISRYAAFEEQIDAFMPPSRRADANQYCKSVKRLASREAFRTAANANQLASAQGDRYFKVNLQSLMRHGTIEFRQHNGMIDADRALNWIRMLDAFITESVRIARQDSAQEAAPAPAQEVALTASQRRLISMIEGGSDNAVTLATLLGWQPHTLRAAISRTRQAGVPIRSIRRQGTTFYAIDPARVAAQEQRRNTTDSLWNGIDAAIATFYKNRAAVLAIAS